MCLAYKAVIEGGESVRKAATDYGVPHSTLHDRISGRVALGATSGPPRYLTNAEEAELVKFLNRCSRLGFARTKKQVITLVQAMLAKKQGRDTLEVSITKPEKVIALKGMRQINTHTSGEKAQITVLACASACGYVMPPMVIYDGKNLKQQVSGTIYGLSDKGWIDTELFEQWFDHHFLHYAPPARPVLLLLDGHSSHYQPSVVRKAAANDVILFCLPPHTTHLAQLLDKAYSHH